MEKIKVALKGFDEKDELEIADIFRKEKIEVETSTIIEKSYQFGEVVQVVKVIFTNFNIIDFARDNLLWTIFTGIFKKLLNYLAKQKPKAKKEVIIKYEKITVVLPSDPINLENMLKKLPDIIKNIDLNGTKSVWISYSIDDNDILIKEF